MGKRGDGMNSNILERAEPMQEGRTAIL